MSEPWNWIVSLQEYFGSKSTLQALRGVLDNFVNPSYGWAFLVSESYGIAVAANHDQEVVLHYLQKEGLSPATIWTLKRPNQSEYVARMDSVKGGPYLHEIRGVFDRPWEQDVLKFMVTSTLVASESTVFDQLDASCVREYDKDLITLRYPMLSAGGQRKILADPPVWPLPESRISFGLGFNQMSFWCKLSDLKALHDAGKDLHVSLNERRSVRVWSGEIVRTTEERKSSDELNSVVLQTIKPRNLP